MNPTRDLLKSLSPEEFAAYEGPSIEEIRAALDRGKVRRDAARVANNAEKHRLLDKLRWRRHHRQTMP